MTDDKLDAPGKGFNPRRKTGKTDLWMAFCPADYRNKTQRLTTLQHGAYMLLIMECWTSGGSVPDDDEDLAAITLMTARDWAKMRPKLERFFAIADGTWTHQRVVEELAYAKALSDINRENGKKGGRPRKTESETKPNANPIVKRNETQTPTPPEGSALKGREPSGPRPSVARATGALPTNADGGGSVIGDGRVWPPPEVANAMKAQPEPEPEPPAPPPLSKEERKAIAAEMCKAVGIPTSGRRKR